MRMKIGADVEVSAMGAAGASAAAGSCWTSASPTSGVFDRPERTTDAVRRSTGVMTQARQPARTPWYCDFGMNLEAAFMIWNEAR